MLAFPTRVGAAVSMSPTIIDVAIVGWGSGICVQFAAKVSNSVGQLGDFLHRKNQFAMAVGAVRDKRAVGGCEQCNSRAVMRSGCGKVGNGVNSVVLVHSVRRRAVSGAGRGGVRLAPFFVSFREEGFEGGPCLVACIFALPGFAVVGKKASLEEKLEGSVDHLNRSVRRIAGGSDFNSVLNLIKNCSDL